MVHPHVHGERYTAFGAAMVGGGSSPRAWGTLNLTIMRALINRFIPTCMGNAYSRYAPLSLFSVHPHVHGERVRPGLR